MTMVAKKVTGKPACRRRRGKGQSGQSLIEFALLVPLIAGIFVALIGVETVISMAVVNQKYTRQHLHFLMFNHRSYMEEDFLIGGSGYHSKYWIGMANKPVPDQGKVEPYPLSHQVGTGRRGEGESRDVSARQNVRVRITSFTCLPPFGDQINAPYSEENLREDTFGASFRYCTH